MGLEGISSLKRIFIQKEVKSKGKKIVQSFNYESEAEVWKTLRKKYWNIDCCKGVELSQPNLQYNISAAKKKDVIKLLEIIFGEDWQNDERLEWYKSMLLTNREDEVGYATEENDDPEAVCECLEEDCGSHLKYRNKTFFNEVTKNCRRQFEFYVFLSLFYHFLSLSSRKHLQVVPLSSEEYQPHPEYTVAIARQRLPPIQDLIQSEEKLQGDNNQDEDVRLKRSHRVQSQVTEDDTQVEGYEDETKATQHDDSHTDAQHFFPSYTPLFSAPPPLGHSRPSFYNPEPAYSQRQTFPSGFRDLSYPHAVAESESTANVLGSGNFGVIRGGTYYAEERDDILNDDIYSQYYNNGHGRPAYYRRNPPPPFRQGDDFFANFRDFADISTPTKSSYSHYYVVYVNRNSTDNRDQVGAIGERQQAVPHNIIEQLALIDSTTESPDNKITKNKRKLETYKSNLKRKEEKNNIKPTVSPKELYEPLLALS